MSLSVIIGGSPEGSRGNGSGGTRTTEDSTSGLRFPACGRLEDGDSWLWPAVDPGEIAPVDHHSVRYDLNGEDAFAGVELRVPVGRHVVVEVDGGGVLALVGAAIEEVVVSTP